MFRLTFVRFNKCRVFVQLSMRTQDTVQLAYLPNSELVLAPNNPVAGAAVDAVDVDAPNMPPPNVAVGAGAAPKPPLAAPNSDGMADTVAVVVVVVGLPVQSVRNVRILAWLWYTICHPAVFFFEN